MKRMGITGSLLSLLMLGAPACVDSGSDNNDMGMTGEPYVPPAAMMPANPAMTPANPAMTPANPAMTPANPAMTPANPAGDGTMMPGGTPTPTPMAGMMPGAAPGMQTPMDGTGMPADMPVAGAPAPMDGTMAPPAELISLAGTAPGASCLSYQTASGGMCASHYCGVTGEQMAMALDPANVCSPDPAIICEGEVVPVVSMCGHQIGEAHLLELLAVLGDEQAVAGIMAAETDTCVQAEPAGAELPPACRECFIKVAICAAAMCPLECMGGDSEACDTCRHMNGCEAKLFDCAGLPNPL